MKREQYYGSPEKGFEVRPVILPDEKAIWVVLVCHRPTFFSRDIHSSKDERMVARVSLTTNSHHIQIC